MPGACRAAGWAKCRAGGDGQKRLRRHGSRPPCSSPGMSPALPPPGPSSRCALTPLMPKELVPVPDFPVSDMIVPRRLSKVLGHTDWLTMQTDAP
jgi:hypothetical protein